MDRFWAKVKKLVGSGKLLDASLKRGQRVFEPVTAQFEQPSRPFHLPSHLEHVSARIVPIAGEVW